VEAMNGSAVGSLVYHLASDIQMHPLMQQFNFFLYLEMLSKK
jgi:hypothetical protein